MAGLALGLAVGYHSPRFMSWVTQLYQNDAHNNNQENQKVAPKKEHYAFTSVESFIAKVVELADECGHFAVLSTRSGNNNLCSSAQQ